MDSGIKQEFKIHLKESCWRVEIYISKSNIYLQELLIEIYQ